MEQVLVGRDKWKSGVSSTARPTADPGGMVLRRFGDGRVWTDTCKMVELFGVVVASTVVGPGKAYALISSEDGTAADSRACACGAR